MAYEYETLDRFYPYYLTQHRRVGNRRMHMAGDIAALAMIIVGIAQERWWLLLLAPVVAYGLSWIGHYAIEHNRPAVFHNPLFSFLGNMYMLRDMWLGRLKA
jgi:hypothetical protein